MKEVGVEKFIKKAYVVHGAKYDYSRSIYNGCKVKLLITCKLCNFEFLQTPDNHLQGKGCKKCANEVNGASKRKSKEQFIKDAIAVHGDKYDYTNIVYKNKDTPVLMICKKCLMSFNQNPGNHLSQKNGCPKCSKHISKKETAWLDSLNIPKENRQVLVPKSNRKFRVDALVKNDIYEFYGDYWHGNLNIFNENDLNPSVNKTYKELFDLTTRREVEFKRLGYNIISMWESDWKKQNERS